MGNGMMEGLGRWRDSKKKEFRSIEYRYGVVQYSTPETRFLGIGAHLRGGQTLNLKPNADQRTRGIGPRSHGGACFPAIGNATALTKPPLWQMPEIRELPTLNRNARICTAALLILSMDSDIEAAVRRLRLEKTVDNIDDLLFCRAPRKRRRRDPDEAKRELEKKYLTPPTTFSTAWLDRLQQYEMTTLPCRVGFQN